MTQTHYHEESFEVSQQLVLKSSCLTLYSMIKWLQRDQQVRADNFGLRLRSKSRYSRELNSHFYQFESVRTGSQSKLPSPG